MKALVLVFVFLLIAPTAAFAQCPSITVIGPAGVTEAGDKMTFTATIGGVGAKLNYNWIVSAGTIIEGQGTAVITVATNGSMEGSNVTAAVEINGLPSACEKTAAETAPIAVRIEGLALDEFGKLNPNDERGRLDSFFAELANNPDNTGLVTLYMTDRERRDSKNRRVQFILSHARFRKFDSRRIWFALELKPFRRTILRRVPPGAAVPCDKCKIIKGGDLR